VLIIFILANSSIAQEVTTIVLRDFETWTQAGLKYEINDAFSVSLDEGLRLWHNSSQVDEFYTNLSLDFELFKNMNVGLAYRFLRENDEGEYESHQRFAFDAEYKFKNKRLIIEPRLRYTFKDELGISKDQGDYLVKNLRFRLLFDYNIKNWKLDPIFSAEIFRQYENGTEAFFDKIRFTLGTKYKLKNMGQIRMFYRLEQEFRISYPQTTNILGIQYKFTIKPSGK
jgi:hypothetical protein